MNLPGHQHHHPGTILASLAEVYVPLEGLSVNARPVFSRVRGPQEAAVYLVYLEDRSWVLSAKDPRGAQLGDPVWAYCDTDAKDPVDIDWEDWIGILRSWRMSRAD